eukprot:3773082-Pleurochrysis_carterae.AAC.3
MHADASPAMKEAPMYAAARLSNVRDSRLGSIHEERAGNVGTHASPETENPLALAQSPQHVEHAEVRAGILHLRFEHFGRIEDADGERARRAARHEALQVRGCMSDVGCLTVCVIGRVAVSVLVCVAVCVVGAVGVGIAIAIVLPLTACVSANKVEDWLV